MQKGIFLLLVCFPSFFSYSQDSCFQFPTKYVNIITNPTFEIAPAACASGYFDEQGLIIPGWTTPTNEVLTGYLNACTNFLIPDSVIVKESFINVYVYMFPLVPQPIPIGNGVAAVGDFGYSGNTHEYPFSKSYVSTCLTGALQQDSLYRLDFYVGFGVQGQDTLAVHNAIASPEMSLNTEKFTLFGYSDCTNINVPIIGCPAVSGWTVLGSVQVDKTANWVQASIKFKSPGNFESIALGPSCDTLLILNPEVVVYDGDTVFADRYSYFLDDLQLNKATVPFPWVHDASGSACSGSIVLQVQPAQYLSGYSWQWYRNGVSISNENGNTLTLTRKNYGTGFYQCLVQNDSTCLITDSLNVQLTAFPSPTVLGNADTVACLGDSILLNAFTDTSSSYLWQDGSSLPYFSVTQSGTYSVTISNACGTVSAQKTVSFKKCDLNISIPNAFTPNGDGRNDFFKVNYFYPITKYKMNIYTRYGQQIFSSSDPAAAWDGTYGGKPQPIGTYVYEVQFTDYKNLTHFVKGTVELIR